MAIVKAYLDDSGTPEDPQHTFLTVAGYVAEQGQWEEFEEDWLAALDEAKVPYLHMREFSNRDSEVYRELRADRLRHLNFMLDAVQVIADHIHYSVQTTIRLSDIQAFNVKRDVEIDPLAFAVYGCILQLRRTVSPRTGATTSGRLPL